MASRSATSKPSCRSLAALALALALAGVVPTGVGAQSADDVFQGSGETLEAPATGSPGIETGELPAIGVEAQGLSLDVWQALAIDDIAALIGKMALPPRTPALNALWRRLISTDGQPRDAGADDGRLLALRLEGLLRAGRIGDAEALAGRQTGVFESPLVSLAMARVALARGDDARACAAIRTVPSRALSSKAAAEAILIGAVCVATAENPAAAALAADLAREQGLDAPFEIALLDAVGEGSQASVPADTRIGIAAYRLMTLTRKPPIASLLDHAEPELLAVLAADAGLPPEERIAAGEAAARHLVIEAGTLAELYGAAVFPRSSLQNPLAAEVEGGPRRALLYQAAKAERSPLRLARIARALLDEARQDDLYGPAATMLAGVVADLHPAPEISWFTETAIEIALVAGRNDVAVEWAKFSGADEAGDGARALPWLILAEIASPEPLLEKGEALRQAERLAARGGIAPELLARLVTVLDALAYDIPIPLWEVSSRVAQPDQGFLPETGVLAELQQAAIARAHGRAILLSLAALGPDGAEGANLLALGDVVRALKAVGLEADARRIGFEALFAGWPRRGSG